MFNPTNKALNLNKFYNKFVKFSGRAMWYLKRA